MDNYYEILNIAPNADENTIKGAIRTLRKKYRQVTGSPNKEQARNAEIMMEKLAKAEQTLLDANQRAAYDTQLRNRPPEQAAPQAATQSTDWVDTAKSYLANGQPRNAAQAAKQAIMVESNNVQAWVVRAYADLEMRDYSDADFSASEAQKRDPQNPEILGLMGDIYYNEERYRDAQQAFQRAANFDPTNPYWQGRMIWAIAVAGDGKQAVADANALVMRFPQSEYARNTYAMMLLNDAESALSHDESSIYFTNTAQIDYVNKQLEIVRGLNSSNETVVEAYNNLQSSATNAVQRRYMPQELEFWRDWIIGMFIAFVILTGVFQVFGFLLFLLVGAGFVWVAVETAYPKQWKINKKSLGSIATNTGIQK